MQFFLKPGFCQNLHYCLSMKKFKFLEIFFQPNVMMKEWHEYCKFENTTIFEWILKNQKLSLFCSAFIEDLHQSCQILF